MVVNVASDQRLAETLSRISRHALDIRSEAACSCFAGADLEALQALIVACDQVAYEAENAAMRARTSDSPPGVAVVVTACNDVNVRAGDMNFETVIPPDLIAVLEELA